MEITMKMAAEMIFISFCAHYRQCEGKDEVERTVKAIGRGGMIKCVAYYAGVDLTPYDGRWNTTILPVLEELDD